MMRIKTFSLAAIMAALLSVAAMAAEDNAVTGHGHETPILHAFRLETDYGAGREGGVGSWDLNGWIGSDYNRLWLKSEGEVSDGETEQAEFWAMYSRNIATFWDAQIGLRYDIEPNSTTYVILGFEGLAPYFFETEAHLFVSDKGDVSLRLREENDFLITQRLILQPYAEVEFFAQDVPKKGKGAGLSNLEIGLQTRYEITRKFAPYIDARYERKIGETSSIAESNGEDNDDFVLSAGLRVMF